VAEENQEDNFKEAFAKLYTQWLRYMQDFLASSLVSTEIYYASIEAKSIISGSEIILKQTCSV